MKDKGMRRGVYIVEQEERDEVRRMNEMSWKEAEIECETCMRRYEKA